MSASKNESTKDIVDQLLAFGIGTKSEILNAIDKVIDKNDINEIIDYIKNKQNNPTTTASKPTDISIFHNCVNEECKSIFNCKALLNMITISKYYANMNDNKDLQKVLQYMDNNNYKDLLSDYHHILHNHLNHENKIENTRSFQYIHDEITKQINCDVYKCNPYQRNNRNREKAQVTTETKSIDANLIFLADILDSIHVYFVHSFDTGFRIPVNFFGDKESKKDDIKNDNEADEITNTIDHRLTQLSSYLKQKRKQLFEIRGVDETHQNKFVTEESNDTQETKEECKQNTDINEYGFGKRFDYWSKNNEWSVTPKYQDLKKEILSKTLISITSYDNVTYTAKKLLNESDTLKKRQMVQHANCYGDIEYGEEKEMHGIKKGTPMQTQHVMSLLLYTNFTQLSYEFSKSFRCISATEANDSIIQRHSLYAHWARRLREVVEIYGEKMHSVKTERWKSGGQKPLGVFYHGVSYLYFNKFITWFNGPISTTKQFAIAMLFANEKGLILELEALPSNDSGDVGGLNLTYFNCSLISAFTNEDERLFIGGRFPIQFKSIRLVKEKQNLRYFVRALSYFNRVINGHQIRYNPTKKDVKIIEKLMDSKTSKDKYQFHTYIHKSFESFCKEKTKIEMNVASAFHYFERIATLLFVDKKVLNLNVISKVFPNVKKIRTYESSHFEPYVSDLVEGIVTLSKLKSCNICEILIDGYYNSSFKDISVETYSSQLKAMKWNIEKKDKDSKLLFTKL